MFLLAWVALSSEHSNIRLNELEGFMFLGHDHPGKPAVHPWPALDSTNMSKTQARVSSSANDVVAVTKALADPVRWKIVERLSKSSASATDLGEGFKISAPAISRHLKVLLNAGVVAVASQGRQRVYSLQPRTISVLGEKLLEVTGAGAMGVKRTPATASRAMQTVGEWRVW